MSADDRERARSRFVEQFAMVLNDAGMQRMPARVFAYVLASDAESHTASQLADGLQVSPAAISGAVRPLIDMGILVRERVPGDRSDHYRVYSDDVWSTIIERQDSMFRHIDVQLTNGLEALEPGAGRRRVGETREFYRFMYSQIGTLTARWRAHRGEVTASPEPAQAASGE